MSRSGQCRCLGAGRSSRRIASTVACLNHGNSSNGKNSSRPSSSSQKPCWEMFVTSTSEVAAPRISNLLQLIHDQLLDATQVLRAQLVVARELDLRLDPELRFALGR